MGYPGDTPPVTLCYAVSRPCHATVTNTLCHAVTAGLPSVAPRPQGVLLVTEHSENRKYKESSRWLSEMPFRRLHRYSEKYVSEKYGNNIWTWRGWAALIPNLTFKMEFGFRRRKQKYRLLLPELRHIEADLKISKWILNLSLYVFIDLSRSHEIRISRKLGLRAFKRENRHNLIRSDEANDRRKIGHNIALKKNSGWYVGKGGTGRWLVDITFHRLHQYSEK